MACTVHGYKASERNTPRRGFCTVSALLIMIIKYLVLGLGGSSHKFICTAIFICKCMEKFILSGLFLKLGHSLLIHIGQCPPFLPEIVSLCILYVCRFVYISSGAKHAFVYFRPLIQDYHCNQANYLMIRQMLVRSFLHLFQLLGN